MFTHAFFELLMYRLRFSNGLIILFTKFEYIVINRSPLKGDIFLKKEGFDSCFTFDH